MSDLLQEPQIETPTPVSVGKCSKCTYYREIDWDTLDFDAYCDNNDIKAQAMGAIMNVTKCIQDWEVVLTPTVVKNFKKDCERVMDFIQDYGAPIVDSGYGRACFTPTEQTE